MTKTQENKKLDLSGYYTVNDLISILRLSRATILNAIKKNKIKAVKIAGFRNWYIPRDQSIFTK